MRYLLFLLFGLVALFAPTGTLAQEDVAGTPISTPAIPAFEIAPVPGSDPAVTELGYFVYELAAGEQADGAVQIRNPGNGPVTVELAAVDAETAQTGGSAFAAADATPLAAGTWLRLDEPRVTLAPGEQAAIGFSVATPAETAPGQYLAGLVAYIPAKPADTTEVREANQASAGVTMQTRYVIGVQIDVPGEWNPSLTITGANALEQPSGTKLGITMRNNGDTFLKPEGSVTLINAAATPILSQPIVLGTLLTGTDITYPIAWPGAPLGGEYNVAVELNYADDKVARYRGLLTVSDDAPVAPAAPDEAPQPAAQPAPTPVPTPAPFPIPMWVLYAIGGLLALITILLILVLIRLSRGGGHRSDW